MKKAIIITLLSLHLIIFFLGTNLIDFAKVPELMRPPVSLYLAATGGHSYAFFSPEIPTQIVVKCYTVDSSNALYVDSIGTVSDTRDLRTNYLFQFLNNEGEQETAARIASDMCFKKHAHTALVRVSIAKVIVPSVDGFQSGDKNRLSEVYTETFHHQSEAK